MFQNAEEDTTAPLQLKPRNELSLWLNTEKVFRINWIARKLEKLVLQWNDALFDKKARLFVLKYNLSAKLRSHAHAPKKGKTSLRRQTTSAVVNDTLQDLINDRAALRENHGDDPLEASRAIGAAALRVDPKGMKAEEESPEEDGTAAHEAAAAAVAAAMSQENPADETTTPSKPALLDIFEDSSDEDARAKPKRDNSNTVTHGARVFQLAEGGPTPSTTVADANNPFYTGPQPDPGVFDEKGNVLIKRPWTDEETEALMYGIRTFGAGKWVQIKNLYGEIFKNRSSVMLKDKYRNLRRQRKLPDDLVMASV